MNKKISHYFSVFLFIIFSFFSHSVFAQINLNWCYQEGGTHLCTEAPLSWQMSTAGPWTPTLFTTPEDAELFSANAFIQSSQSNPIPYTTILWSADTNIEPHGFYTGQYLFPQTVLSVVYGVSSLGGYVTVDTKIQQGPPAFCTNGWRDISEEVYDSNGNLVWVGRCQPRTANQQLLNNGFAGISGKDSNVACQSCTKHPVNIASGNQQKYVIDTQNNTPFPIIWARYYNTAGSGWNFTYSENLDYFIVNNIANVILRREDGSTISYTASVSNTTSSYNWSTNFTVANQKILSVLTDTKDSNGNIVGFNYKNTLDEIEAYDISGKLLSITDKNGNTQTMSYDSNNRLSQITDNWGNKLIVNHLAYSSSQFQTNQNPTDPNRKPTNYSYNYLLPSDLPKLSSVSSVNFNNDSSTQVSYSYLSGNTAGTIPTNLITQVSYPNNTNIEYQYDSSYDYILSAITDQKGNTINNYSINGSQVTSENQGVDSNNQFINQVNFSYRNNYNIITDGLGNSVWVYANSSVSGINKPTGMTNPCPIGICDGQSYQNIVYDSYQNPTNLTDFNGNITTYTYDTDRGLILTQTEASNTTSLSRTTSYIWNSQFRLVNTIIEPINVGGVAGTRLTTNTYDSHGNLTNMVVSNSINTNTHNYSFTYNSFGQVLTATDANNHTTTYNYLPNGNLSTIVNALGQTIATYSNYDGLGTPHTIIDANGLRTNIFYDNLQRPTSIAVGSPSTHYETSLIFYEPTGKISEIKSPDNSFIMMNYDAAQRLTSIQDYDNTGVLKGSIVYTLDAMSNITKTQFLDASGNVVKSSTAQYNQYNWLSKNIGSLNQTTSFTYDNNQNITKIVDPLNRSATNTYDALNRLTKIALANSSGTSLGNIQYSYDVADNLTSLTDQNGHTTNYYYDAFDRLIKTISPDTGTIQYTYDAMGNILTKFDANGNLTTNTYDSLNRLSTKTYSKLLSPSISQTFTYDTCTNGIGHICTIIDQSGTTAYSYDLWGRISSKQVVINNNLVSPSNTITQNTNYTYNTAGQLTNVVYPSGMIVNYTYKHNQILNVSVTQGGITTNLLSGVNYLPMTNIPTNFTWGNGTTYSQTYDTDYNIQSITNNQNIYDFTVDPVGNIQTISNLTGSNLNYTLSYTYNDQDELIQAENNLSNSNQHNFSYDLNGNRLSSTITESTTANTTNYAISSSSNQLNSLSGATTKTYNYDNDGNIINDSITTFNYDITNRLTSVLNNGITTNYIMNALGQRIAKTNINNTTYFSYDSTNSNLLGEYNQNGTSINEYIYIDNKIVGVVNNNNLYYVITDQIDTPRQIIDNNNNTVWQWDNLEPFGNNQPSINTLTFNLRFSGQYFDNETNLNYNYFRNYDSSIGRYIQSDPIGLNGGMNTYGYAMNNTLNYGDYYGLYSGQDFLNDSSDWVAGFGDNLSYGITKGIRNLFSIGSVDLCSNFYNGGNIGGFFAGIIIPYTYGTKATAIFLAGDAKAIQYSHSLLEKSTIKALQNEYYDIDIVSKSLQWLNKNGNRINGDYMPTSMHRLIDPYARQFASKAEKAIIPKAFEKQSVRGIINRIPYTIGGLGYSTGSYLTNNCGCDR